MIDKYVLPPDQGMLMMQVAKVAIKEMHRLIIVITVYVQFGCIFGNRPNTLLMRKLEQHHTMVRYKLKNWKKMG